MQTYVDHLATDLLYTTGSTLVSLPKVSRFQRRLRTGFARC